MRFERTSKMIFYARLEPKPTQQTETRCSARSDGGGARYLLLGYTVMQNGLHWPDSLVHSVGNRNPEVRSISGLAELPSKTYILPSSFIVLPLLEYHAW